MWAFTLVEMMISIALVVLLMLGVNMVFSLSGRTVGAGQALSTVARDNRSAQSMVYQDLGGAVVADGPGLIIRSERVWAWRNIVDEQSDIDKNFKTIDIDGNNVEGTGPGETLTTVGINSRNHRVDRLVFFSRGQFLRQTGTSPRFIDTAKTGTGSSERNVPTSSGEAFITYGHLKLPSLVSPTSGTWFNPGDTSSTNDQNRYATDWVLGRSAILLLPNPPQPPFGSANSFVQRGSGLSPLVGASGSGVYASLIDVAQTDIDGYKDILDQHIKAGGGEPWYTSMSSERFRGNPNPAKPITTDGAALAAPCFVAACTQFIVDYAGDFVTQDVNGTVSGNLPDGIVDFAIDTTGARRVRWFGFPRDTNNDGVIDTRNDVTPFKDFYTQMPWERELPSGSPPYTSVPDGGKYIVAWGPDLQNYGGAGTGVTVPRPKLIRITLAIDDAQGRIGGAQTYEYICEVR